MSFHRENQRRREKVRSIQSITPLFHLASHIAVAKRDLKVSNSFRVVQNWNNDVCWSSHLKLLLVYPFSLLCLLLFWRNKAQRTIRVWMLCTRLFDIIDKMLNDWKYILLQKKNNKQTKTATGLNVKISLNMGCLISLHSYGLPNAVVHYWSI